jgi:hypothetical protein
MENSETASNLDVADCEPLFPNLDPEVLQSGALPYPLLPSEAAIIEHDGQSRDDVAWHHAVPLHDSGSRAAVGASMVDAMLETFTNNHNKSPPPSPEELGGGAASNKLTFHNFAKNVIIPIWDAYEADPNKGKIDSIDLPLKHDSREYLFIVPIIYLPQGHPGREQVSAFTRILPLTIGHLR